jgi:hypothetical protein
MWRVHVIKLFMGRFTNTNRKVTMMAEVARKLTTARAMILFS